jgi:hypothetical protein
MQGVLFLVLVQLLEAGGHDVHIIMNNSKEVKRMLKCVIISEHIRKFKAVGKKKSHEEKVNFIKGWVELITHLKFEHSVHMAQDALCYLNAVSDGEHILTARCAFSKDVYMYQCSSSSSAESMNRANMAVQEQTTVNLFNATILH